MLGAMTEPAAEEQPTVKRERPRPLDSLQAASARLTRKKFDRFAKHSGQDWQTEARVMYRNVGEHRFVTNALANQIGQVRFYVGTLSDDQGAEPEPIELPGDSPEDDPDAASEEPLTADDLAAYNAWQAFGGTAANLQQMVTRCAVNLLVPGEGWFVGVPPHIEDAIQGREAPPTDGLIQGPRPAAESPVTALDLSTLTWRFLSIAEIKFNGSASEVTLTVKDAESGSWTGSPDEILAFRCWRPDPFEWWMADSPTQAALPILRKILGIGDAEDAQLDSRLTGAGVFLVPQTADNALRSSLGPERGGNEPESPFMAAMMDAFEASIQDRSSAARTTPIVFTVPDESIEKFKHITFSSPLDGAYAAMEERAIGRLALSYDAPKELLLGVSSMNHWGAWLVKEDTVNAHVRPPAAIMADSFTQQYLWPVLEDGGMDPEVAHRYVAWFTVEHLIVRPNRFEDAKAAYDAGQLSGDALRRYGGFDDDDAPESLSDPALAMVLQMVHRAPALAETPGIPALVEQIRAAMAGQEPQPANDAQAEIAAQPDGVPAQPPPKAPGGVPATANDQPAVAASGTPDWSMPGITDENLADALEDTARRAMEAGAL